MTRTLRHPNIAPAHPGELVAEIIEDQKGNKSAIAEHLGVTRAALYNVLDEKSAVTAEMAVGLERAIGISADLLVSMQAAYDLWRARQSSRLVPPQKFASAIAGTAVRRAITGSKGSEHKKQALAASALNAQTAGRKTSKGAKMSRPKKR